MNRIFSDRALTRISAGIIILGIIMRLWLYLQNRCLIIDETNITRNLYERDFLALTKPLSYEQFAPPVFLWALKCFSFVFGFSEYGLRLFPMLSGIACLWLLYMALKQYADKQAVWYGLLLFAMGAIYLRYSSELKQYMCDAVVILALMLLAIRLNILTMPRARFVLAWCLIGSAAIWCSMPSVFMLAGVGCYYFYICIQTRKYNNIWLLIPPTIIWLIQFAVYYTVILKPSINIGLLQDAHKDGFLYALPFSQEQIKHNIFALRTVLSWAAGASKFSAIFHITAMTAAAIWLLRRHTAKALLLIIPLVAVCAAAAKHQYTLTPRLILFAMPLLLILIATGIGEFLKVKYTGVKVTCLVIALICAYDFGFKDLFAKSPTTEDMTQNLVFLQQQKITAEHLYVQHAGVPAYLYYTVIHPGKERFRDLVNAHLLEFDTNYDSLSQSFTGRSALLCGWQPEEDITFRRDVIKRHHKETLEHRLSGNSVFIYE